MSYFIHEGVNAICTFQISPSPQKFVATRSYSVLSKDTDKAWLTAADKNIDVPFICKSPVNVFASFLALGAGILVGAALFVSGPIGWGIAIACATVSFVVAAHEAKEIKHKCSGMLLAGEWAIKHSTVKLDGKQVVVHSSLLTCKAGGVLTPIISDTIAAEYARSIAATNIGEVTLNSIVSFIAGVGAVASVAGSGILSGIKTLAGGYIKGTLFIQLGTWAEREAIRKTGESITSGNYNEVYSEINNADKNIIIKCPDNPSDVSDQLDVRGMVEATANVKEANKQSTNAKNNLARLEKISTQKTMTDGHKNTWFTNEAKADFNALKESNPELFKNGDQKVGGTLGTSKLEVVKNNAEQEVVKTTRESTMANNKAIVSKIGVAAFWLPFVSTLFSESTRYQLACAIVEDATGTTTLKGTEI
jgi:hypothetical protein